MSTMKSLAQFLPSAGPYLADNLSAMLCCPRCNGEYLHHGRVVVYDRLGEDGTMTDVSVVDNGLTATHRMRSAETDNPSARRDGIVIEFGCESCRSRSGPLELRIAQHKGQTFMEWRFPPADPE